MPEETQTWLPKGHLARFEELASIVGACTQLGVSKVRLTGGEPLLRRHLPELVAQLNAIPAISDLALTTNAVFLEDLAHELRQSGLSRITVSLDTLHPSRYAEQTRRDSHSKMIAGIQGANTAGFAPIKLNAVIVRGFNDDEIGELLNFARAGGHHLRFIEYMDVGGAQEWTAEKVVSRTEILECVREAHGDVHRTADRPAVKRGSAPAEEFTLEDGTQFGIISSMTAPFCLQCDRARLTADGRLFTCLYASTGLDLLGPLRQGASEHELCQHITTAWQERTDQTALDRSQLPVRGPLASNQDLLDHPHLGMHTKGG